jgi:hypothetical protein
MRFGSGIVFVTISGLLLLLDWLKKSGADMSALTSASIAPVMRRERQVYASGFSFAKNLAISLGILEIELTPQNLSR